MKTINFRKDFSPYPGPCYRQDGWFSAEEFRDDHLIPALKEGGVSIELDGTRWTYPHSFLEEVFGGAVRKGFKLTREVLNLVSEDERLKQKIWKHINNASKTHG